MNTASSVSAITAFQTAAAMMNSHGIGKGNLKYQHPYVVHAELNAILNSKHDLKGCSIYVSLFPCNECAKAIIQSGISRIVYESDKYAHTEGTIASKRMLRSAGGSW